MDIGFDSKNYIDFEYKSQVLYLQYLVHHMEKYLLPNFCRMVSPRLKNFEGLISTEVVTVSRTVE